MPARVSLPSGPHIITAGAKEEPVQFEAGNLSRALLMLDLPFPLLESHCWEGS